MGKSAKGKRKKTEVLPPLSEDCLSLSLPLVIQDKRGSTIHNNP